MISGHMANDISSNFKDRQFTGDLDEIIANCIRYYTNITKQITMNDLKKAFFFSNILKGAEST